MTSTFKVPFTKQVTGFRLHVAPNSSGPQESPRPSWLLDVRDRMVEEAREQAELTRIVAAVESAIAGVPGAIAQNLEQVTALAVELGLAVAAEIVGDAIERELFDPTVVVERCLRQAIVGQDRPELRIELCPADLSLVIANLDRHPELRERVQQAEFVANPSLAPKSVDVSTATGRLVYDPMEVLGRVCDEIRREVAT